MKEETIYLIPNCEHNQRKAFEQLSKIMIPLAKNISFSSSYKKSKELNYEMMQEVYHNLQSMESPEYIFYLNLAENFDNTLLRLFPNTKFIGLFHSSFSDKRDYGSYGSLVKYQEFLVNVIHMGFPISQFITDEFKRWRKHSNNIKTLFLPLIEYKSKLNERENIKTVLWNHRVSKVKDPYFLMRLSEKIFEERDDIRILVSTTGWTPQILREVQDFQKKFPELFKVHVNPSPEEYQKYINTSTIGISTTTYDTFSGSVIECINEGLLYFTPDGLCFTDYVIDECRYTPGDLLGIKELIFEIVDDDDLRSDLLSTQRQKIKEFGIKSFKKKLEQYLGIKIKVPEWYKNEEIMEDLF